MKKKVVVLIDGGNLRALTRVAGHRHVPDYIEKVGLACAEADEEILRILYYDCAPYVGTTRLPVSGTEQRFSGSDGWLHDLARRRLFAIRLGVLKFRGFRPKRTPIQIGAGAQVTDDDFEPIFEQKGVDMRIGLDIALYSETRAVERIILITQDTDCIPAMKHGRKAGLQVVLIRLPNSVVAPELLEHADLERDVAWPV